MYCTFIIFLCVVLFRILFRSGKADHREDKFYNASLQVIPLNYNDPLKSRTKKTKDGYYQLGEFDKEGFVHVKLEPDVGKISKVRIQVHTASENWVIVSEVRICRTIPFILGGGVLM